MTDNKARAQKIEQIPALGSKAVAAARRAQTYVETIIRQRQIDYVSINIERLTRAPRKGAIEFWIFNEQQSLGRIKHDNDALIYSAVANLIPIAVELYLRWPLTTKPSSIILLSDGQNLLFNPGRLENRPHDIINAHISGESPMMCVVQGLNEQGRPTEPTGKLIKFCNQGLVP